ncbi:VOC family protein [Spirillospora sp. NPDC047279]|uniref:VOC family protein n=1 Tax=Spirillospora sp. NPDC047279 TaxID=3155478 RepID=UPI0033EF6DA2
MVPTVGPSRVQGPGVGECRSHEPSFSHDHVGLSVTSEDLDATIEWYSGVFGFDVERRFDSHGTTFVFLACGDVRIELLAGASDRQEPTGDVLKSMAPRACTISSSPSTPPRHDDLPAARPRHGPDRRAKC